MFLLHTGLIRAGILLRWMRAGGIEVRLAPLRQPSGTVRLAQALRSLRERLTCAAPAEFNHLADLPREPMVLLHNLVHRIPRHRHQCRIGERDDSGDHPLAGQRRSADVVAGGAFAQGQLWQTP